MLNSTERITYRIKLVFFFSVCSVCKAIGKVINDELTENQKLPTRVFWIGVSVHDLVCKIITNELLM
jgi:hypothetical protein